MALVLQLPLEYYSFFFSVMYNIGTVLPATESRNVEYKTGGGNYPLTVLPSVCEEQLCLDDVCEFLQNHVSIKLSNLKCAYDN